MTPHCLSQGCCREQKGTEGQGHRAGDRASSPWHPLDAGTRHAPFCTYARAPPPSAAPLAESQHLYFINEEAQGVPSHTAAE